MLVTPCALARSPYAAVVVSVACVLQEPAPVDEAPAAQTGSKNQLQLVWPGPTLLQRQVKIVDESPWDTTAPSRALMVRTGIQDKLALAREAEEVLAEQTVDRFIEAHNIERGLNNAVLDPKGSKTGHAGHATGRAIRVVEVPDVIDVDPGIEAL